MRPTQKPNNSDTSPERNNNENPACRALLRGARRTSRLWPLRKLGWMGTAIRLFPVPRSRHLIVRPRVHPVVVKAATSTPTITLLSIPTRLDRTLSCSRPARPAIWERHPRRLRDIPITCRHILRVSAPPRSPRMNSALLAVCFVTFCRMRPVTSPRTKLSRSWTDTAMKLQQRQQRRPHLSFL